MTPIQDTQKESIFLSDQNARQQALNPLESFLIQAPAGSGKTELLVQRMLALLPTVHAPEEILAMTFTKKAAQEMQSRVIQALEKATRDRPELLHEQRTWDLARAALDADEAHQWGLLEHPHRLTIQTIDSLCRMILQQAPLSVPGPHTLPPTEHADILYQQAAEQLLQDADPHQPWSSALEKILLHFDHHTESFSDTFSEMLNTREQWFFAIQAIREGKLTLETLNKTLKTYQTDWLHQCEEVISQPILSPIWKVFLEIFHQVSSNPSSLHTTQPMQTIQTLQGIAHWILTDKGDFRKRFTVKEGFHPEHAGLKTQLMECLDTLSQMPHHYNTLKALLNEAKTLPPADYNLQDWEILQACAHVLPIATALLHLTFAEEGVTDFTESALQALTLLEDNQNHLAMRLDLRVRHILIDEFQDTSLLQYRLIKTLIAEWTPDSGKTLFLVGDPMQSIYRFRQANVGIFLDAKHHGIPPMPLTFLQLTQNFRSDAQLIHAWNQHFSVRMPTREDLHAGAISFASSTPTRQFDDATPPEWISELAKDARHEAVYQTLLTWQTEYPQDSIALLVHSRRQLTELLPYLSQRGIRWHAQDIQPMQHIPAIQDALSLTCALLHTGDEIAWASILRSPWIQGSLTFLTELFAFKAHQAGPSTPWECLKTLTLAPESLPSLAQDAQLQTRLHRLIQAFERAFSCLGRIPTALCVKALWQDLNRSLALDHHEDPLRVNHPLQLNCSPGSNKHIETLETFWDCMKSTDPLLQEAAFLQQLSGLYASRKEDPSIRLSVMTIHKSKGLEFDRVILLDQAKSKPSSPLLRFHSYSAHGEIHTLLAPKSARGQEASPLFQFLSDQEKQQDRHERERVRYVGCTRARKALKVFGGT